MRSLKVAPLLALLALALTPTIGRAETSSELVYPLAGAGVENEPVVAKVHRKPPITHGRGPQTQSPQPDPSATEERGDTTTGPEGESRSAEHHQGHAALPGNGGGHPPGDGGGEDATRTIAHTQAHPTPTATGASKSTGGGGGSSPVLLILIAIAILAVGSVGIALYRERKQSGNAEGHPGS